jgi:predicted O-linked N-acetylglucosamine transferase (SPINDLY family)
MGRHKFSKSSGGTRKTTKRDVARFLPKNADPRRLEMTAEILSNIFRAQVLYDANDWDSAAIEVRRLLKRKGFAQPLTYDALACCLQFQGKIDLSLKVFRKCMELDPDYVDAQNRIVMIKDAQPETTQEEANRDRRTWWKMFGAANYARRMPHLNNRDPERPLRIGYVSADFHFHSAMSVVKQIATRHSEAYQAFLYSSTPPHKYDQTTTNYTSMPGWRDVHNRPTSLVVSKILADRIDILMDLSSFTSGSRLQVFAWKPAPIQLIGWGYAHSTGFPCFDGVMTDAIVGVDHPETEQAVCLPSILDYEPLEGLPEANPLPCLTERPTFALFQRSLKMNTENLGVYREILRRLPEARLIIKSHYSQIFIEWIRSHFGDQNAQVEIRGATSSLEHKKQYQEVDLALDTWPQCGGVSTCDMLHMGVPCVTLAGPGARTIQLATSSLLTSVGLPQFIARSHEEYIQKAIYYVTEGKHELAAIRPTLRQRLAESPVCADYLPAVEDAYRNLWRQWCAKPLSIDDAMYRLQKVS